MSTMDTEGIIIDSVNEEGLITRGSFTVAVPTTADKFAAGCILVGNDGKVYTNTGTSASPSFQDINSISTDEIAAGAVTLAKLATIVAPSHIVKFFKLGSTITGTTLTGAAVGDLVLRVTAAGAATVEAVVSTNTLPTDPADTDYVIVFRATS